MLLHICCLIIDVQPTYQHICTCRHNLITFSVQSDTGNISTTIRLSTFSPLSKFSASSNLSLQLSCSSLSYLSLRCVEGICVKISQFFDRMRVNNKFLSSVTQYIQLYRSFNLQLFNTLILLRYKHNCTRREK